LGNSWRAVEGKSRGGCGWKNFGLKFAPASAVFFRMNPSDAESGFPKNDSASPAPVAAREPWGVPTLIPLDLSAARGFFCSKTNDGSKDLGPMNCS
jgi:hypothetical protein